MESTGMDLRSCMDGALFHDGGRSVSSLEARWMETTISSFEPLSASTSAQRSLDAALFRNASSRPGVWRNTAALAGDHSNDRGIHASEDDFRPVAGPLSGMGQFCGVSELYDLAIERLIHATDVLFCFVFAWHGRLGLHAVNTIAPIFIIPAIVVTTITVFVILWPR